METCKTCKYYNAEKNKCKSRNIKILKVTDDFVLADFYCINYKGEQDGQN